MTTTSTAVAPGSPEGALEGGVVGDQTPVVVSRWWPVPTSRVGLVLLLIGVACIPLGDAAPAVAFSANTALVIACIVDLVRAVPPRQVLVTRDWPAVLVMDTLTAVRADVTNRASRLARVSMAEAMPPSLRPTSRRSQIRVPSLGTVSTSTTVRPGRRGRIALGDVTVRSNGPLGLMSRQATLTVPGAIRVHPAFPSRVDAELALQQAARLTDGARRVRQRGQGTDFAALREYTPDDETRRIDWAATARALKPIVRTYQAERNQHLLIMLDHGRTMAGRIGRRPTDDVIDDTELLARAPRLEHAMDAAMALTRVATGLGDRVGLVTFTDIVTGSLPTRGGRDQMVRMVQALSDVEAELIEPDYVNAFGEALASHRRRAMVVVITDIAAAPVMESLRPALPLLSQRHLLVVASPTDPNVMDWTQRVPADADAAYRMAASLEAQQQQTRTARSLRLSGARVIADVPTVLPGRLIRAYLDAKSIGRL